MTSISILGVVAVLAALALVKVISSKPQKAEKSEKAEIIRQLLALSERDNPVSATPLPARSGAALPNLGKRPDNSRRKGSAKTSSQPIRYSE